MSPEPRPASVERATSTPAGLGPNRARAAKFLEHSITASTLCTVDFARAVDLAPDPKLAALARRSRRHRARA
jgi:hypothetical protein